MMATVAEKINYEGAKDVITRYKRRKQCAGFNFTDEKLVELIVELARQEEDGKHKRPNACINCSYSAPWHGRFTWTGRYCSLGIWDKKQCHMRVKIVDKGGI